MFPHLGFAAWTSVLCLVFACGGTPSAPAQSAQTVQSAQTAQSTKARRSESALQGHAATDVRSHDLSGRTVKLSESLGKKVILLNFWGTFCDPCKAEFPHLQKLYSTEKSRGLEVIAVAVDGPDTLADVPAFVQRNGLTFPVWLDEDTSVRAVYNPKSDAPVTVLIDRRGRVRHVRVGYNAGDEVGLEAEVRALLAEP